MLNKVAPLLGLPLLFSACSAAPGFERQQTPVVSQWSPGDHGQPAEIDWRGFFGDPRLRKLVELALVNNRDARVAALNVEQTRAQYQIQRSALLPTVMARTGATLQDTGEAETRSLGLSVGVSSYELDLFGRVRSLNRSALETYLATTEANRSARLALVSEIATQYLTERALIEQIALSERTLGTTGKTHELMKKRVEAGDASELDVQSVNTQVQTAKVNLAAYRQQLSQAQNALTLLVGGSLPKKLPSGRSLGDQAIVADLSPGLSSQLLHRRPDIREAEHQLLAAHANIGAARAAFFPSITLTGNAGVATDSLTNLFQGVSGSWLFSPQISIPLFARSRLRAGLEVAEVRREIEVAQYEKAIQTAFREVADAMAVRRGVNERIAATDALVAAQQKRFELADARYQRGVDSYFQVLDAQQDLYAAQQSLIQLRLARLANRVTLYKALGGGW